MTSYQDKCNEILANCNPKFDGCLIWQGKIDDNGHGYTKYDGKKVLVHTFIAQHHNKNDVAALNLHKFRVEQTCGHTICCESTHLVFKTGKPEKQWEKLVDWWNEPAEYRY